MRIVFLGRYNPGDLFQGPEKVARRIADEMASAGHIVHFYEYFFDGRQYGAWAKLFGRTNVENESGIEIKRLGLIPLFLLIVNLRCDVIHIITFERFAILAIILKIFKRAPIVYSVHGIVAHESSIMRPKPPMGVRLKDSICEYLFFRYADMLFFLSERSKAIASEYYHIASEKTAVVSNGVDAVFSAAPEGRKDHSGVRIVFVGEPGRSEKGFAYFLRSLARCRQGGEVFVICEKIPGADVQIVNNFCVHFIAKMETQAYAEFLSKNDVYVNTSSYENFSLAAVEAMSAGLVPIVTHETGMSRYIDPGVNGYLVHFDDEVELARILDLLIANERLRKEAAMHARSIYGALLWKNIAKDYIARYQMKKTA